MPITEKLKQSEQLSPAETMEINMRALLSFQLEIFKSPPSMELYTLQSLDSLSHIFNLDNFPEDRSLLNAMVEGVFEGAFNSYADAETIKKFEEFKNIYKDICEKMINTPWEVDVSEMNKYRDSIKEVFNTVLSNDTMKQKLESILNDQEYKAKHVVIPVQLCNSLPINYEELKKYKETLKSFFGDGDENTFKHIIKAAKSCLEEYKNFKEQGQPDKAFAEQIKLFKLLDGLFRSRAFETQQLEAIYTTGKPKTAGDLSNLGLEEIMVNITEILDMHYGIQGDGALLFRDFAKIMEEKGIESIIEKLERLEEYRKEAFQMVDRVEILRGKDGDGEIRIPQEVLQKRQEEKESGRWTPKEEPVGTPEEIITIQKIKHINRQKDVYEREANPKEKEKILVNLVKYIEGQDEKCKYAAINQLNLIAPDKESKKAILNMDDGAGKSVFFDMIGKDKEFRKGFFEGISEQDAKNIISEVVNKKLEKAMEQMKKNQFRYRLSKIPLLGRLFKHSEKAYQEAKEIRNSMQDIIRDDYKHFEVLNVETSSQSIKMDGIKQENQDLMNRIELAKQQVETTLPPPDKRTSIIHEAPNPDMGKAQTNERPKGKGVGMDE